MPIGYRSFANLKQRSASSFITFCASHSSPALVPFPVLTPECQLHQNQHCAVKMAMFWFRLKIAHPFIKQGKDQSSGKPKPQGSNEASVSSSNPTRLGGCRQESSTSSKA